MGHNENYYDRATVYNSTLAYFKGDELAANVWVDKYCLRSKANEYMELTPVDMFKRLAKAFSAIEHKYGGYNALTYDDVYKLLADFKYVIPGGSILNGVGNDNSLTSLGNCFVIGNSSDSYGGIFLSDEEQAQLMKRRAGVGHDISHLRPRGSAVNNAAISSTGAVSFMHRFSNTTLEVSQGGRRGALMLTMSVDHPDIIDFIKSKVDRSKVTGANISVKVTNEFMQGVVDNKPGRNIEIWHELVKQARDTAEPGILFWDTVRSSSIPSLYGAEWQETSTNPCGEIPLCPYDSCRLMSINLYSFVEEPFTVGAHVNYDLLYDVAYKAQRLMDDLIDLEEAKIDAILNKILNGKDDMESSYREYNLWLKIKSKLLKGRRTGLSGIGLADLLAALGITYGSEDSVKITELVYKTIAMGSYASSIDMAQERGHFDIWSYETEKDSPFINKVLNELKKSVNENVFELYKKYGRRNISNLTIPPSGSISILAGISSGIEPVYMLTYKRRRRAVETNDNKGVVLIKDDNGDVWEEFIVYHKPLKDFFNHTSVNHNEFLEFINSKGFEKQTPYYKATAYEIDPFMRVKIQAAAQKWVDHSISSTINLKSDVTEETVANIYKEAWLAGCKGITVYRDGSRTGILVSKEDNKNKFEQHDAPKRPKELKCDIHSIKSMGKGWLVIVGLYDNKPYEVFAIINETDLQFKRTTGRIVKEKKGKYDLYFDDFETVLRDITKESPDEENMMTRLISTSLRHGADIKFIVEQLYKSTGDVTSFCKAIARTLVVYTNGSLKAVSKCENCGSTNISNSGGCITCLDCGHSKCL